MSKKLILLNMMTGFQHLSYITKINHVHRLNKDSGIFARGRVSLTRLQHTGFPFLCVVLSVMNNCYG
jgi:hypothetical protein